MKKTVFTLALLSIISILTIDAQITSMGDQYQSQFFLEHVGRIGSNNDLYLPDEYVGTPYGNPIFLLGNIYEQNKIMASNYALRYNAMTDEIEVKENLYEEDTEIMALTKNPEIYVKIMADMFVFREANKASHEAGYFQVLHVGTTHNLYKKIVKKYYPAKNAQNSFEKDVAAKFVDRPIYYLVSQEGNFEEFGSSKNKRLKLFKNKQSEIKKLIKSGKLDLTEEEDLLRVVKYYDAISSAQ
ncbi:MAG: hypothetical protein ACI840_002691 [Ulvibacter sp.]|jgi:hypothetical protein